MTDAIELETHVSCIVGILPRERIEPQPIRVDLVLELDLEQVGDTGELDRGVDYAAVDGIVRFLAVEGQFLLIESLALAVLRAVLRLPGAPVSRATVRIAKPTVMRAACPAVRLSRDAAWAGGAARLVAVPEATVTLRALAAGERVDEGAVFGLTGALGPLAVPLTCEAPATVLHLIRSRATAPAPAP